MGRLYNFFGWSWLLSFALFAPISLPAGGSILGAPKIINAKFADPLITPYKSSLRTSPFHYAKSICSIHPGTPLLILRSWHSQDGTNWLKVQTLVSEELSLSLSIRRGWINV